jgi:hypothetical protein
MSVAPTEHERPSELDFAPAAAAILAVGIGTFVIGVLTTWAEASTGFADALNWKDRVGPLSGKTIIGTVAYFLSWAVLTAALRGRTPRLRTTLWLAGILVALGLIGTFPTFFEAFAPD